MRNAKLRGTVSGVGSSSGAGIKTVLINDQAGVANKWQHKISAEDLAGGGEIAFILAIASEDTEHSVCIPTVEELPELKDVNELKFYVYSGFGLANFSKFYDGVHLGTGILGSAGIRGGGCLIARKHDLDENSWLVTHESFKESGDTVLKDWTSSTAKNINLLSGFDVESEGSLTVEIRNLKILSGELNVFLKMSKMGGDLSGLTEQSYINGMTNYNTFGNADLFELSFKPIAKIISANVGKAFFKIERAVIDVLKPVFIDGVSYGCVSAQVIGSGGLVALQNTGIFKNDYLYKVKSSTGVAAKELNLGFAGDASGVSFEYRVIKKQ